MSVAATPTQISLSERRKQLPAIIVLLLNTGLMWFGFFMLIPLVAFHATRDLGMSAAMAGLVLAVRQFVQQGLGVFVAVAADWLGYRRMMLLGALIRSVGFAYLAFAPDALHLLLSGIVAALGGACFDSSGKAAVAALSKGYNRDSIFSLTATFGNIGMTTGPLLGVALLDLDFKVVGLAAASVYILCFGLLLAFVPPIPPAAAFVSGKHLGASQVFGQLGIVWRNRPFVIISFMFAGYYILSSQLNITLPLVTARLTGSKDNIALLYAVNSGIAIALQFVAVKFMLRFFKPVTVTAIGTLIGAIGLTGVAFATNLASLLSCIVFYSFGRLLVEPVIYSITAKYATNETMASYFGFGSLALALGGVIGNAMGGWLYDLGNGNGFPALCWLVFGATGAVVVSGIFWFQHLENSRMRLGSPLLEEALASPADS